MTLIQPENAGLKHIPFDSKEYVHEFVKYGQTLHNNSMNNIFVNLI